MLLRYHHLSYHEKAFQSMTGLWHFLFDEVVDDVKPKFVEAHKSRLDRNDRQRVMDERIFNLPVGAFRVEQPLGVGD